LGCPFIGAGAGFSALELPPSTGDPRHFVADALNLCPSIIWLINDIHRRRKLESALAAVLDM